MREAYLINNSQSAVTVPLYEKKEVPVIPAKVTQKHELSPGEELVLGVDLDDARLRYYEQLESVNVTLAFREPTVVPASQEVAGVVPAIIHDLRGHVSDEQVVTGYKVSAKKYEDRDHVRVSIEGTSLYEHTNGAGVKGYWIGFAVKAPEGATKVRVGFAQGQNYLVLGDLLDVEQAVADGAAGVAFYTNLSLEIPKLWTRVAWFNDSEEAIGEVTDFYMDISKVTLAPRIITEETASVQLADTFFATLKAAIEAAEEGDTVVLLKDLTFADTIEIPEVKHINLDLNGKSLTGSVAGQPFIVNNGDLTVIDTIGGGVVQRTDNGTPEEPANYVIHNIGTLTINGGKFFNNSGYDKPNSAGSKAGASLICNDGVLFIAGGEYQQDNFIVIKNQGRLEMTGGSITTEHSAIQNWSEAVIKNGNCNGKIWTDVWDDYHGRTVISGGTHKGEIRLDYTSGDAIATLDITGGTFDIEWLIKNAEKFDINISGGVFTKEVPAEYCAEGYVPVQNSDGLYTVESVTE